MAIFDLPSSIFGFSTSVSKQSYMTNTLHRYSEHYAFETPPNPAPVQDDFIVFAMASRGINDDDLVAKYRTFLRLALKHNP